jgi:hypothetical protein
MHRTLAACLLVLVLLPLVRFELQAAPAAAIPFPQFRHRSLNTPLPANASFVLDLERDDAIRLPNAHHAWGPQGDAFLVATRTGVRAHFADGTSRRLLGRRLDRASWSSTGLIAFAVGSRVIVVDEIGRRVRALHASQAYYQPPLFSWDGSLLLFGDRVFQATDWKPVGKLTVDEGGPAIWSPDNANLAIMGGSGKSTSGAAVSEQQNYSRLAGRANPPSGTVRPPGPATAGHSSSGPASTTVAAFRQNCFSRGRRNSLSTRRTPR